MPIPPEQRMQSLETNETNKEIGNAPVGRIYTRLFKRESIGNLRFNSNIHTPIIPQDMPAKIDNIIALLKNE